MITYVFICYILYRFWGRFTIYWLPVLLFFTVTSIIMFFVRRLYFAFYWRFWMEYCTPSSIYFACSLAASCFSCLVGVIPSYLYNSLAASLIIVFIVLQFARWYALVCLLNYAILQPCCNIVYFPRIAYIHCKQIRYVVSCFHNVTFLNCYCFCFST